MKIFVKLAGLTLCVILLCATLCGCQELDDARNHTAVFTDDSMSTFTFRDATYKFIGTPKNVSFILDDTVWGYNVTPQDVPVLLADSFGYQLLFHDTDGAPVIAAALNVNVDTSAIDADSLLSALRNSYYYAEDRFTYYVREDKYEDTKKLLESAELDRYYMNVYEHHNDDQTDWYAKESGYYISVNKLLDQDMTDAVNRTLKDGAKATWIDLEQKRTEWYSFQIYPCDEDILITNGKIYNIVTDTFDYYIYEDNNDDVLYQVSNDDFEQFRRMYKLNDESIGVEDVSWHIRYS